jgi:Tfp pilus assembly protein PilV
MSLIEIIISVIILAMILGGILLLKKSATKFNLTAAQLKKIKQRNQELDKKERQDE